MEYLDGFIVLVLHVRVLLAFVTIQDPCDPSPCGPNGACHLDKDGTGVKCHCFHGFHGKQCGFQDPCVPSTCGPNGTCHLDKDGTGAKCHCFHGFHGKHCEQNTCEAHHNPCGDRRCVPQEEDPYYKCVCQRGYFGEHCKQSVCDIRPCQHGSCHLIQNLPYFNCQCEDDYTGALCEELLLSNTSTSATATLISGSTDFRKCDKYKVLSDVVDGTSVENNMTTCHSGSHSSPEALVINDCNVTSSVTTWKKGVQVLKACRGEGILPTYTPVGVFVNDVYVDVLHGGTAGVFFGCLPGGGFKFGVQDCDSTPQIKHVNGTVFTMDPSVYFAIIA